MIIIESKTIQKKDIHEYLMIQLKKYIEEKKGQKNKNFNFISSEIIKENDVNRIEILEFKFKILIKFISENKIVNAYIEKNKYDYFDFKNFFEDFNKIEYGKRTKI